VKQIRKRLTYANVMSSIAVFLVIGGATAFAALGKNSVGTKQLKSNAVTTAKIKKEAVSTKKIKKDAVTGDQVKESTLSTVPSATNATNATNADSAKNASNASNSEKLGGVKAAGFVQQSAQSGEILTGQISVVYEGAGSFFLAGGSYRSPLPASVPTPTLVYTTSTTPQCGGVGQAASGILCVYGYNTLNVEEVATSGNFSDPNKRYGFSLDVFPVVPTSEAYLLASWAYRVP
jgi:hypothetical protein